MGKYRLVEGKTIYTIPAILELGLQPASVATIIRAKLDSALSTERTYDPEGLNYGRYYDTGDFALYGHTGVKIVKGNPTLWKLVNGDVKAHDGGIVLDNGVFEDMEGLLLDYGDIDETYNRAYTQIEALKNPVWKALMPETLLRSYLGGVEHLANAAYSPTESKNMGILFNANRVSHSLDIIDHIKIRISQPENRWKLKPHCVARQWSLHFDGLEFNMNCLGNIASQLKRMHGVQKNI